MAQTVKQRRGAARMAVQDAIRRGILIRPPRCERCGEDDVPIHAHHHLGYDKAYQLAVRWLCPECHATYHQRVSAENKKTVRVVILATPQEHIMWGRAAKRSGHNSLAEYVRNMVNRNIPYPTDNGEKSSNA